MSDADYANENNDNEVSKIWQRQQICNSSPAIKHDAFRCGTRKQIRNQPLYQHLETFTRAFNRLIN